MTLIDFIEDCLKKHTITQYIKVVDCDGFTYEIRISDHRANNKNNRQRHKDNVLSFVSSNKSKQESELMDYEWIVDPNTLMDRNYYHVTEILKDFSIHPNQKI